MAHSGLDLRQIELGVLVGRQLDVSAFLRKFLDNDVLEVPLCNTRMVSSVTLRYFSSSVIAFCPSPRVPRSSYAFIATRRAAALSVARYRIAYRSWLARSNAACRC